MPKDASKTKIPSLKKYFQYMGKSRTNNIQIAPTKIQEIIESDIQIPLSEYSPLLREVITEAFTFYMHNWPGWQRNKFQDVLDKPEETYSKLKEYLKEKILNLKEKEKEYVNLSHKMSDSQIASSVLKIPQDVFNTLPNSASNYKIKLPYTLEITGHPSLFNSLNFQKFNGLQDEYCLSIKASGLSKPDWLQTNEILNHPFVMVHFKMPKLIKFSRTNSHKIEMFLCKPTDNWTFPKQDRILDIRYFPSRTNVYTCKFMQGFFNKLVSATQMYGNLIDKHTVMQVKAVCDEFLQDILEANLHHSTVQECTDICFNIGGSVYFSDTAKDSNAEINLRRIYNPQVSYSLIFCAIEQSDIRSDGSIKPFDNHTTVDINNLTATQRKFVAQINSSLHYTCKVCEFHCTCAAQMVEHLLIVHPLTDLVSCAMCKKDTFLYTLLGKRWKHECVP